MNWISRDAEGPNQVTISGRHQTSSRWDFLRELVGLGEDSPSSPEKSIDRSPGHPPHILSHRVQFNATADCQYAAQDPAFRHVVHVFHQNWHGIRSAAGSLPGQKMALPLQRRLASADMAAIATTLADWHCTKAVFHGYSDAAERVLRVMSGQGIECYLVWHGNLAQLVWQPEGTYFNQALAACRSGLFQRAHMLKVGTACCFPRSYEPLLLNSPPHTNKRRLLPAFSSAHRIALVPGFPDIRKNLYGSLVGASTARNIETILHYAEIECGLSVLNRCKRVSYRSHDAHISLLHDVDVTVNVTTIDCHPMVDLEAIGAGAMALTGPLYLDALQDHLFTRLSVMENPFDAAAIGHRLDLLATMPCKELESLICDYRDNLRSISKQRYAEFLQL